MYVCVGVSLILMHTLCIYEERARWCVFNRSRFFIDNVQGLDAQGTYHDGSFFVKGCACSYTDAVTCMRVYVKISTHAHPKYAHTTHLTKHTAA